MTDTPAAWPRPWSAIGTQVFSACGQRLFRVDGLDTYERELELAAFIVSAVNAREGG
jgi:hypothetical protein